MSLDHLVLYRSIVACTTKFRGCRTANQPVPRFDSNVMPSGSRGVLWGQALRLIRHVQLSLPFLNLPHEISELQSRPPTVPPGRDPPPDGVPVDAPSPAGGLGPWWFGHRTVGSRGACFGGEGVPPWMALSGHQSSRSNPPTPTVDTQDHYHS